MEADEAGTIKRQKAHLTELVKPTIAQHNGNLVKLMGDGMLVEFSSVVDAVQCAVTLQRAMVEREASISEDRKICYRIGINLGDIFFEENDIFGDGVNIAARLEQIAEPGGICVSGTAFDHLKSNIEVGYEFLGELNLKNIQQAVRAYRILIDEKSVGEIIANSKGRTGTRNWAIIVVAFMLAAIGLGIWWWGYQSDSTVHEIRASNNGSDNKTNNLPGITQTKLNELSIAVLPFDNLSGDPEQEYFSDGMTEDLITDLSQVSSLFVLARNTMFTYKGKAVNVQQVARELGVRYVLEGSVRKSGDRVRINAQLIDAQTGGHIWANRYDRNLTDVFALQDDVVQKIVSALKITLKPAEKERLAASAQAHPKAYDLLLRGLEKLRRFTRETNLEAQAFFEQAVVLDPSFVRAHADLALTHALKAEQHWTNDPANSSQHALEIANHALTLDNTNAQVYFALSVIYRSLGRSDDAVLVSKRTVELEPNYADGYATLAISLNYAGYPSEGLKAIKRATKLNPRKPFFYLWTEGQSNYLLGRYEEAAKLFEQVTAANPEFTAGHKMLAATYSETGRIQDAEWAAAELLTIAPEFNLSSEAARISYKDTAVLQRYIEGLRAAGLE
jgi:adenylate cyclase